MTQATGNKLISGLLVEIDGKHYKIPFTMKNTLIMFFSYWISAIGKKFHLLYLVELISFVEN